MGEQNRTSSASVQAYDHVMAFLSLTASRAIASLTYVYPCSPLLYPLILLPSAIPNDQVDAPIRLFNPLIANPIFATVPFVQHDGPPSTSGALRVTRNSPHSPLRPSRAQSDKSYLAYLLTLAGIIRIRVRLTNTSPYIHRQMPNSPRLRHRTRLQSSRHLLTRTLRTGHIAVGASA